MSALDTLPAATSLVAGSQVQEHLRQLPILLRLVQELERLDRVDATSTGDPADASEMLFVHAVHVVGHILSTYVTKRILDECPMSRAPAGGAAAPHRLTDARLARAGGSALLDVASRSAIAARPGDGTARYLRRLCLEHLQGPAVEPRADGDLKPTDLRLTAAWLQAAEDAAALGATEEAERCLRAALEIDPDFNRARRRYAELVRRHDPDEAAAQFAIMLEHQPRLRHGVANFVEHYRGFLISYDHGLKAFIAQPAFLGLAKLPSLRPLLRRRNRFLGLLAMRIHLARRVASRSSGDQIEPPGLQPPRRADLRVLHRLVEFAHRWLAVHPDMLRFIVKADREATIRWKIDQLNRIWLAPGELPQHAPGWKSVGGDAKRG